MASTLSRPAGLVGRRLTLLQRGLAADLNPITYKRLADRTLEHLQEQLELFVDEHAGEGSDVEFSGDVLSLTLASKGTIVLNKQSPNKQIWSSSPLSGPLRYDLADDHSDWICTRDPHRSLGDVIADDVEEMMGSRPAFSIRHALAGELQR